jgi:tripartite ATP-independent transporter DctM subunit
MKKEGYDDETSVGVTAASSTLGSIIPPSITMVVFAGIANVSTGGLFMSGLLPGIMLGLAQMGVIVYYSKRRNFPKGAHLPIIEILRQVFGALPALITPIILIGGIVTGLFTPTEAAAIACLYALFISLFIYRTIKLKDLPRILVETMKLSSLSLFALATANALGELMSFYRLNEVVQGFFISIPGGQFVFLLVVVAFFLFIGTFMDAVPAMILFVPIVLPSALALGISPIILGLIVVITLSLGLVTPPYGLCLLLAASIGGVTIEKAFRGVLPYLLVSLAVLLVLVIFPDFFLDVPKALFPILYK